MRKIVINSANGLSLRLSIGSGIHRKPACFNLSLYLPGGDSKTNSCPCARIALARAKRKLYRYQSVFANNNIFIVVNGYTGEWLTLQYGGEEVHSERVGFC